MTVMIGMVSQKGGVGKSTLSRLVAREYAAAGWEVNIVDLDVSQGTSTDWKQRREQHRLQPEVAVEPFHSGPPARRSRLPHSMICSFSTGRRTPWLVPWRLRASNLVVLPSGLSLDDLKPTTVLAHELVEAGVDTDRIVVALCRVGDRENEIEELRVYIRKAGYACLKGSLPREDRRASDEGRAVSEVTFPTLRERAEEITQNVIDRIGKLERREVA